MKTTVYDEHFRIHRRSLHRQCTVFFGCITLLLCFLTAITLDLFKVDLMGEISNIALESGYPGAAEFTGWVALNFESYLPALWFSFGIFLTLTVYSWFETLQGSDGTPSVNLFSAEKNIQSLSNTQRRLLGIPRNGGVSTSGPQKEPVIGGNTTPQKRQPSSQQINSPYKTPTRVAYTVSTEPKAYSTERSHGLRLRAHQRGNYLDQSPSSSVSSFKGTNSPFSPGIASTWNSPIQNMNSRQEQTAFVSVHNSPFGTPMSAPDRSYAIGTPCPGDTPLSVRNQSLCTRCSSPIAPSPFQLKQLSEASETDSAAFSLLLQLPVDWDISGSRKSRTVSDYIDEWTDNVTKALCKYVREHIVVALEKNTEALSELPGSFFSKELLAQSLKSHGTNDSAAILENARLRASEAYSSVISRQASQGLFSINNQQAQQQQEKAQAQQALSALNRLLSERTRLAESLTLSTTSDVFPNDVVLQKIKVLFGASEKVAHHRLNNYHWDSSTNPMDPDVVIHIACDWLDHILRADNRHTTFGQYHVRNLNSQKPYTVGSVSSLLDSPQTDLSGQGRRNAPEPGILSTQNWWGLQRSLVPGLNGQGFVPHYDVVVQGELWNVRSGRHNALQAVTLFIYSMKYRRVVGVESLEHLIGGHSYST